MAKRSQDTVPPAEIKPVSVTVGAEIVPPPPGGWPLPPELEARLEVFREELGRRWKEPPPDAVRADLALLDLRCRLIGRQKERGARSGQRNASFRQLREVLDLIGSLNDKLPALLETAREENALAKKEREPTNRWDWVLWQGEELRRALIPWKEIARKVPRKPDFRSTWHPAARELALLVAPIIRAGTGRAPSLTKRGGPLVRIVQYFLIDCGFRMIHDVTIASVLGGKSGTNFRRKIRDCDFRFFPRNSKACANSRDVSEWSWT